MAEPTNLLPTAKKKNAALLTAIPVMLLLLLWCVRWLFLTPHMEVTGIVSGVDVFPSPQPAGMSASLPKSTFSQALLITAIGNYQPLTLCGDESRLSGHNVHLRLRLNDKCYEVTHYDDLGISERVTKIHDGTRTNLGPRPSVEGSLAKGFPAWVIWKLVNMPAGARCELHQSVNMSASGGHLVVKPTGYPYVQGRFSFQDFSPDTGVMPVQSQDVHSYLSPEFRLDGEPQPHSADGEAQAKLSMIARKQGWDLVPTTEHDDQGTPDLRYVAGLGSDTQLLSSSGSEADCRQLALLFGHPTWMRSTRE
jgi:hypothetical protein